MRLSNLLSKPGSANLRYTIWSHILPIQVICAINFRTFVPKETRMARPLKIAWKHTEEELYDLYRQEKDVDLARRWQALWLLRRGERLIRVKAVLGVMHTTIQRWVRWYEAGGIEEVARHKSGRSYLIILPSWI